MDGGDVVRVLIEPARQAVGQGRHMNGSESEKDRREGERERRREGETDGCREGKRE